MHQIGIEALDDDAHMSPQRANPLSNHHFHRPGLRCARHFAELDGDPRDVRPCGATTVTSTPHRERWDEPCRRDLRPAVGGAPGLG